MDDQSNDAQRPVEPPVEQADERFNPFRNEGDMFKIVLWVAGVCFLLMVLLTIGRAIF